MPSKNILHIAVVLFFVFTGQAMAAGIAELFLLLS
jgi:hypothetical protein